MLCRDEDRARRFVTRLLWPYGFECRFCAGRDALYLPKRELWVCRRCRRHHSLTSGTPLQGLRGGPCAWIKALFVLGFDHVRTAELADALRIHVQTARRWKRLLNESPAGRELADRFWSALEAVETTPWP